MIVYRSVHRGDHLTSGRVRADATLDVDGDAHSLHLRGTFTGRRDGDAVPVFLSAGSVAVGHAPSVLSAVVSAVAGDTTRAGPAR